MKKVVQVDVAPARPHVHADLFKDRERLGALRALYSEIRARYDPREYGYAAMMEKQLKSAADLMVSMSAEYKTGNMADFFDQKVEQAVSQLQEHGPDDRVRHTRERFHKAASAMKKAHRSADASSSHRRVAFEETNTKLFHNKFRSKRSKRYIQELYPIKEGVPDVAAQPQSDPEWMCNVAREYYEYLMSEKKTSKEARDEMLAHLRKRKLSDKSKDSLDGKITPEEVRSQMKHMAVGKSPGPDMIPAEYYRAMASCMAEDLAEYYNEMLADGALQYRPAC